MRRQLLLTLALAILGTVIAAGTVNAGGGGLVDSGSAGVDVNLPGGDDLPDVDQLPACSNTADDDGDGAVDMADGGCSGPLDGSEAGGAVPTDPTDPIDDTVDDVTDPGTDPTVPPPPPPDDGTTVPPEDDGTAGGGGNDGQGQGTAGGGGGGGGGGRGDGGGGHGGDRVSPQEVREPVMRRADGTPTRQNPAVTIADSAPAPIGVSNFVIDQFSIPPFLLPIYQACGTEYDIPWPVLASINRIETNFGQLADVTSTAGAVGWMQFMPATWRAYGVDANNDGEKDPYNPVDAICAAARYLNAAGGEEDLRTAIFAYNHADWYVDEVLLYARQYGRLPEDLVGSLTGLTEGARFPVAADARYADDLSEREALERSDSDDQASQTVSSSPTARGINIFARDRAPVVAVNDGVVKRIGHDKKLGDYLVFQDSYGNRFTYAELGSVAEVYPVPKEKDLSADDFRIGGDRDDEAPDRAASAGRVRAEDERQSDSSGSQGPVNTEDVRQRLFAFPERDNNVERADLTGQLDELLGQRMPGYESVKAYMGGVLKFDRKKMELRELEEGSKVTAGTVLGRIGKTDELAPHLHFSIRPAGRGAPRIDPKPILDGWKLLEATAIYRAAGDDPFGDSGASSAGQVLLMSKEQLERRLLADPRVSIYECGRQDIQTGQIERRILALLEYLSARGFRLTVTSLKCGHSTYTSSGNVSHHSTGTAVDIAQINGMPVLGNQGRGSITEALILDILELQGSMLPDQVISLMQMGGPTFSMSDHADHVHVGYAPAYGEESTSKGEQFTQVLKADQWKRLIGRIAEIKNPEVPTSPSEFALPSKKGKDGGSKRASSAHLGE